MSYADKTKALFNKYGKVAIAVHLGVYVTTFTGCYVAAEKNTKIESYLAYYGLISEKEVEGEKAEPKSKFSHGFLSGGSSIAIAFLCAKALLPIRVPLTLALTPPIARFIQGKSLKVKH